MMDDSSPSTAAPKPRPYFFPPGIDLAALPPAVRLAFDAIVQPAYEELVLAAPNALERSAGVTLTFVLAVEVLEQFELGHQFNLTGAPAGGNQTDRDRAIARHLKVLSAKQQVANFLVKLGQIRNTPRIVRMNVPSVVGSR